MTLTALTRFISKRRKGEIFQVERGSDGHATIYFYCKDSATGKNRHFAISCDKADKIRVYPETFSKLSIQNDAQSPTASSKLKAHKSRKIVSFDKMYITGYGFQSIYVPIG